MFIPHLLLFLSLLLLSGCVPAPHGGYYHPTTTQEGAEVHRRSCGGKVGPEDSLVIHQRGLTVRIRFERQEGGIRANIPISVAGGAKLRVLPGAFVLEDLAGEGRAALRPQTLMGATGSGPIDEPVEGPALRSLLLRVPEFSPTRFRLTFPPLEINGRVVTVAPVDFDYRAGEVGIYPLNC